MDDDLLSTTDASHSTPAVPLLIAIPDSLLSSSPASFFPTFTVCILFGLHLVQPLSADCFEAQASVDTILRYSTVVDVLLLLKTISITTWSLASVEDRVPDARCSSCLAAFEASCRFLVSRPF